MGIRRRYKRLRYFFSWKYPKLFHFVRTIAFPVQVLALCLALFAFVSFYQKHFSFEASMRARTNNEVSLPERSIVTRSKSQLSEHQHSEDQLAIAESDEVKTSAKEQKPTVTTAEKESDVPTETETAIIAAIIDPPLTPPLPTGTALIKRTNANSAQPTTKLTPPVKPELIELAVPESKPEPNEIFDSEWLARQRNNQFVIQLATSSQYNELVSYAKALPVTGPLVIFPFKKNSAGGLVYGLSAGLHDSFTEAKTALDTLPQDSARYGYWIRAVAEINSRVTALAKTPE